MLVKQQEKHATAAQIKQAGCIDFDWMSYPGKLPGPSIHANMVAAFQRAVMADAALMARVKSVLEIEERSLPTHREPLSAREDQIVQARRFRVWGLKSLREGEVDISWGPCDRRDLEEILRLAEVSWT